MSLSQNRRGAAAELFSLLVVACFHGGFSELDYTESLSFLHDLTKFGINFGLGRIRQLMELLGDPQEKQRFIHVGGTNGKGSTSAMITSVLSVAGYKVGLFTSPHLSRYTERIRIGNHEIQQKDLAEMLTGMRHLLETFVGRGDEHPTEFEVETALALDFFSRSKTDLNVLEVGLGGIIDSTNVINNSLVTVITNVGLDHMDYLGSTVEEIARVKAGIIKERGRVVTAVKGTALGIIEDVCREKKAELIKVPGEITWEQEGPGSLGGQTINLHGMTGDYPLTVISLAGRHQQVNAALALGALECLQYSGVEFSREAFYRGLATVQWPGRLEVMAVSPLVIFDAAHNHDGTRALRESLEELVPARRIILVVGMLADKERTRALEELLPFSDMVVVTKPNNPRAGDWRYLATVAGRWGKTVISEEEIGVAMIRALEGAGPDDLVLVTGSIYMVGEARQWFLVHGPKYTSLLGKEQKGLPSQDAKISSDM